MDTRQIHLKSEQPGVGDFEPLTAISPQLVFVFGSVGQFTRQGFGAILKSAFPSATVIGCTTAGEIGNKGVFDNSLFVTGARFKGAKMKSAKSVLSRMEDSVKAGEDLGRQLRSSDLRSIVVFGRGVGINGSDLIRGIEREVGPGVTITGGLAGDGGKFERTYTLLNGDVSHEQVVAIGFCGDGVKVSWGSMGGWEPFGPARRVTKASGNVLHQLDGQPALKVYKEYLGEHAKNLPASGLLFPFAILKDNQDTSGLIRTILAVDEKEGSLTLAGDIPENGLVRLMHTDSKGLVGGAEGAAKQAHHMLKHARSGGGLALLISCVGRKIVMGGEVDQEIDAVQEIFGKESVLTGFYSYGEICPVFEASDCKLHNQTMTITYFSE